MLAYGSNVCAAPTGGAVSAGSASIAGSAGNTTINQASQNVAINWQSFGIAQGEVVRFVQPNSSSVALNRVVGSDASGIYGRLSANGKVFLVNPNGILFAPGAQVNVGALVASTRNITDGDFMAGKYNFSGTSNAPVLNQGSINADGGYVALLGANVSNQGVISARLGTVVLAAGNAMTLDIAGDGLLNVVVTQGAVNALVQNGGAILADGGQVLLTVQAAGNLLQSVINNTGLIQAQTIENHNGTIRLMGGMQSGSINVGGTLDASAPNGGSGGFIETSAATVNFANDSKVTTFAPLGLTGTWLIDPLDFTVAVAGGDITGIMLSNNLLASNITITNGDGIVGTAGDIHINTPVHWAGATTLTLNAVHDVFVAAAITADTAGAGFAVKAGHDVSVTAPVIMVAAGATIKIRGENDVRIAAITATAANSSIDVSAGNNLTTTGIINTVAAASSTKLVGGNDVLIGGSITATAADSTINLSSGRDTTINAPITAVAAGSLVKVVAGRDVITTTTAAMLAVAANTTIDLSAQRNVSVNSAIAASAAGAAIRLIAGLGATGPGAAGGTVTLAAAVASPNLTIRFNPNGYANTAAEIAAYPALADAKAWVFLQVNNKTYDGTSTATMAFKGTPADGGAVSLTSGIAAFDSKNAGSGKTVTFSGFGIGGADAGRFALSSSAGTTLANVDKRALNVTAAGTNKTYDGTTAGAALLADNRIAGDALTLSYASASFADKNAGKGKAVSVTGINLAGANAGNYSFNTVAATIADITQAPLTVTASNVGKTYGESPTLSGFTQMGLVGGETIGSVTEMSPGTAANAGVAGNPYAITPSGATGGTFNASNYNIKYVSGVLTVIPAGMLVTVANTTKTYGQSTIETAFTVEGLVNGETVGAFDEYSAGSAASATVEGSPYPITSSPASGGTITPSNYSIRYINGELTIVPQARPAQ